LDKLAISASVWGLLLGGVQILRDQLASTPVVIVESRRIINKSRSSLPEYVKTVLRETLCNR
jgi:hypothetical protein